MPRLMSVAYTKAQVYARTKTVTRRLGWINAHPGDVIELCEKVMGRKAGDPLVRICRVRLVDVRREPLTALTDDLVYGFAETEREGFPGMDPAEFIRTYFTDAQGITPDTLVTRLEWEYL